MNTKGVPEITTHHVGSKPKEARLGVAGGILFAIAMGVLTAPIYDRNAGTPELTQGIVVGHGTQAVGRISVPTTLVRVEQGAHRGQEALVMGKLGQEGPTDGTTVTLGVTVGPLSGHLFGHDLQASDGEGRRKKSRP